MECVKRSSVLLLHVGNQYGGVDVYIENLALLLQGLPNVDVIALASHPRLLENLRSVGTAAFGVPARLSKRKVLRTLFLPFQLLWLVKRYSVQTIILNDHAEALFILPGKLAGCRVFVVAHGVLGLHDRGFFQLTGRFIYTRLARFSDMIICVSQTVMMAQSKIAPHEKLAVIRNWLPTLPVPRESQGGSVRLIRLLFVGRLMRVKGAHLVIEAIRGIENVVVTIVGDGPERASLEVASAGLPVTFAGFRKDTGSYYQRTDIFVNPALDEGVEGLPFVSLESMSYGLACIFSRIAVHEEITDSGFAAELFRPGDVADLRRTILRLVGDIPYRRQLGDRARTLVERRHGPDAAKDAYTALLTRVGW
jgi:glycosyltransferase involved in cell wall biosynthesis